MKKAEVKVNYQECSIFVLGMDMKCPLCGALVVSGQKHTCFKPDTSKSDQVKK